MSLPYVIMLLVTLQRLSELVISARNTKVLMQHGAVEHGAAHYPAMIALHGSWLILLWLFVGGRPVNLPLLGVFAVLQALRIWVLATLGTRWTTRIIVVPGAERVTGGPFRLISHPNYAVVVAEIAVLPLVFGLIWIAVLYTVLNALMLYVRIGAENRALESSQPLAQR
jgi:methyltransferase